MTELEKALKDIDTTTHPNGLRDGIIYYNEEGDFCVYNHYSAVRGIFSVCRRRLTFG